MATKKDYLLGGLAGLLTGVFLVPTLENIGYDHPAFLIALPIVLALAWVVGLVIGQMLATKFAIMWQLAKFAEIGVLNTVINFGLLNLASLMTGVTAGIWAGGYNVPATIIAATNSYFWNKLWVFKKIDNRGLFNDVPKFVVVTLIGLVVNSVVIIAFTTYWQPVWGVSSAVWLNLGKILATILGVLIDFLGYKFIVFKEE